MNNKKPNGVLEIGRVVFKRKGHLLCAYLTSSKSMANAYFLGAIRYSLISNPETKNEFDQLMVKTAGDILQSIWGEAPQVRAPEYALTH